jgi:Zn ribbon nucleic-acid-binding protein
MENNDALAVWNEVSVDVLEILFGPFRARSENKKEVI